MPAFLRRSVFAAALLLLATLARAQQHILPAPALAATPLFADDHRYQPPRVLNHPTPAYPEAPHLNRIEGVVRVRFSVGEDGKVTNVVASQSSGSVFLDSALMRDPVLRAWTFAPAAFDGQPVPSTVEREFEFRLDPAEERALALQRLALPVGTPAPPYPARAGALQAQNLCALELHWTGLCEWPLTLFNLAEGTGVLGLYWTDRGLVDLIYLEKSTGSRLLDNLTLRWVYTHWRIDPKDAPPKGKDGKQPPMLQTLTFTPAGADGAAGKVVVGVTVEP